MSQLSTNPVVASETIFIKTEDFISRNGGASSEDSDVSATVVKIKSEMPEGGDEHNNGDSKTATVTTETDGPGGEAWNQKNVSCSVENSTTIKQECMEGEEDEIQSFSVDSSKNMKNSEYVAVSLLPFKEADKDGNKEAHSSSTQSNIAPTTKPISSTIRTRNSSQKLYSQTTPCAVEHRNERPFSSTCCARLKTKETAQSSQKLFSCSQCTAVFKERSALKKHTIMHSHERPYTCKYCAARFKTKGILKTHLAVHSRKKPFSCAHCVATFKTKGNLKGHLLSVHSTEKPVGCPHRHCKATFKTKGHLKNHMSVHLEKRPFSCADCTAAFKTKSDLKRHLVVHSCEKPFACVYCPAAFKTRNLLKQHLVVHLNRDGDKKPFACKCCAAVFETEELLKAHVAQHSNMLRIHCFQRLCSGGSCACVCILCVGDT